ncbi:MAG TPA: TRAP transporter small permease [Burkholderiaceae bacterium]|nr:TRAP transporter small permease [Burkholderiaceae bacterium]
MKKSLTDRLRHIAEFVLVLMMGILFVTFIAQVVFRYVLNIPLAWSDEISNYLWLWGILWGSSFVMRNHEDMRFDMLYNMLPRKLQRSSSVFVSCLLVLLLILSVPKTWAFIGFMNIEKSPALGLPMSWVFGLYLVFVAAMCVRHVGIAYDALHDKLPHDGHSLIDAELLHTGTKS